MMYKFDALEAVKVHPFVRRYVMISLVVFVIFFLLLFLPWQQTVRGTGSITALNPVERNYKIVATIDGVIENFYVKENQYVNKGDKLFSMRDLDTEYQSKLSNIVSQYRLKLDNMKESDKNLNKNLTQQDELFKIGEKIYVTKLEQLHNTLSAVKLEQTALQKQYKIETIHYQRAQRLFKEGIESKRDLELKEFTYLKTEAKAKKIVAEVENIYNDINITRQEKIRFENETDLKINTLKNKILDTQNTMNTLAQNIAKSSVNLSRYLSKDIVAKSNGYVMRIYQVDKNKLLKTGEEIMHFSPTVTQRALRLKVSAFNMPLIKEGLKARIILYGWPAMNISGWPKITHGTYGGVITSVERTAHEKDVYYAVIVEDKEDDPWPLAKDLRIGTEATVWVRLKTVSIWYELWRLLSAQPPKMVTMKENNL